MKMTKKIVLTLLFTVGMAFMGAVTGLLAPVVPAVAGLAVGFAGAAAASLGLIGSAVGMLGYGAGLCAAMLLFQPAWLGLAAWYAAFLMLGHILVQVQLKQKLPLVQVMFKTAAWLFMFGMASYVALYYLAGDGVSMMIATLQSELQAVEALSTEVYDMMLSLLSVRGFLPDVGLTDYVMELDAHTRLVLSSALLDLFDESLRMSILDVLVKQALNIALIAPLMVVMSYARKAEGDKVSKLPDLAQFHLPRRVSTVLFVMVLGCILLMLLVKTAAPVYVAGMTIFEFAYAVQGLSVGEWFFRRKGMNRSLRFLILGAVFVLLPTVMFLLGFAEQIFSFRKIQQLKDSGLWEKMRREHEEEMERRMRELEEEKERLRRERDKDDDSGND